MADLQTQMKQAVADAAVEQIKDGMVLGLGSGSTAALMIKALGAKLASGDLKDIVGVTTSFQGEVLAAELNIPLLSLNAVERIDLAIDGADEIDARLWAIKGAGGAMLREKAVAAAARRFIVIADGSKRVENIGAAKLPVEVLPFARAFVSARLEGLGAAVSIRPGYETDNGNLIADCQFPVLPDPQSLAARIDAIPGALGHGLFIDEVDVAFVAQGGLVTRLERKT